MIEEIKKDGKLVALIIRRTYWEKGANFMTDKDSILQFGVHVYDSGHVIKPHVHNDIERNTRGTQEIFHVESGEVLMDFYDVLGDKIGSVLLHYGDTVIDYGKSHGFWFLKFSKIIEVKNGPYESKEKDKVVF